MAALRLRGLDDRIAAAQVQWREKTQAEPSAAERTRPSPRITVVVADDLQLVRSGFRVILDAEPDITVVGGRPTAAPSSTSCCARGQPWC